MAIGAEGRVKRPNVKTARPPRSQARWSSSSHSRRSGGSNSDCSRSQARKFCGISPVSDRKRTENAGFTRYPHAEAEANPSPYSLPLLREPRLACGRRTASGGWITLCYGEEVQPACWGRHERLAVSEPLLGWRMCRRCVCWDEGGWGTDESVRLVRRDLRAGRCGREARAYVRHDTGPNPIGTDCPGGGAGR